MSSKNHLLGLIDLVYQAVLDADLWPAVLIKLADTVSASQIAMPSFDWRANVFATIAPRFDPEMVATYENYWAFREPLVSRAAQRPVGELYVLDNLMSREEFAATPVFNEFWRPTGCGLAASMRNLGWDGQNPPCKYFRENWNPQAGRTHPPPSRGCRWTRAEVTREPFGSFAATLKLEWVLPDFINSSTIENALPAWRINVGLASMAQSGSPGVPLGCRAFS